MNENKPVTAEEIARKVVEKNEGYSFRDTEWIKERGVYIFSHLEEIAEEYATLKTQELTAELEAFLPQDWHNGKKLTERLDCLVWSWNHRNGIIEQLTAENERLREVFKRLLHVYINSEWQKNQHFSEQVEASIIHKWLTQAGINLTHKD